MEQLLDEIGKLKIPSKWKEIINRATIETISGGKSEVGVYKLTDSSDQSFLLKITDHPDRANELEYENRVLDLLEDMEFAPKMYFSMKQNGIGLSVREYIDGKALDQCDMPVNQMVKIAGDLLKKIHNTKIKMDGFITYTERIEEAKSNILKGNVNEKDFNSENLGIAPEDLFEKFIGMECEIKEDTFVHGDYNFPNIIYTGRDAKVIDWGSASFSDPYQDISLLVREHSDLIDFITSVEFKEIIQNSYGINKLDERKIEKFILLDEFF
jgi:aminoglycoside phosphotransferase